MAIPTIGVMLGGKKGRKCLVGNEEAIVASSGRELLASDYSLLEKVRRKVLGQQ